MTYIAWICTFLLMIVLSALATLGLDFSDDNQSNS